MPGSGSWRTFSLRMVTPSLVDPGPNGASRLTALGGVGKVAHEPRRLSLATPLRVASDQSRFSGGAVPECAGRVVPGGLEHGPEV